MFDLHCHILPGVDDGSGGLEESILMIRSAAEQGTVGIVATPHANIPGGFTNYYDENLSEKYEALRKTLAEKDINVSIFEGQEIFCSGAVLTLLREGKLISLNNSSYILVEFAFREYASSMIKKIARLRAEGYIPIVAHPERYDSVKETTETAKQLKSAGALLQVNSGSIEGHMGQGAFSAAHRLLQRELCDFVASDAHSPYSRTACMDAAHEIICEEYDPDYAKLLFEINPKHVLKNERIY